ncbi:UNVERIFIED_CONTAM: protein DETOXIFICATION 35 [Sesamum calycinum]|uniref:Protein DETOXIFICATION 35 n=1 Tax=Sesamum calycinum TaxID=2727403 RepID=A0AAW2L8E6_9LAMI
MYYQAPGRIRVSHLAYANDLMIFTTTCRRNMELLHDFLRAYERVSSQLINGMKSSIIVGRQVSSLQTQAVQYVVAVSEPWVKVFVSFWHDNWLGEKPLAQLLHRDTYTMEPVSHYRHEGDWNVPRILRTVPMPSAQTICQIPIAAVFLWRLFHDRIPVDAQMRQKGFSFPSKCQCCEAEETVSHLFLESTAVQGVWQHFATLFGLCLYDMGNLTHMRNAAKYRGVPFSTDGVILDVQRHLCTLIVRWRALSPSWFKLNTDGSSLGNPGLAVAAGIIRDSTGHVHLAYQIALGTGTSVLAELTAIWRGLELALTHGLAPLVVEVDATVVISLLQSRVSRMWEIQHLIMHIVFFAAFSALTDGESFTSAGDDDGFTTWTRSFFGRGFVVGFGIMGTTRGDDGLLGITMVLNSVQPVISGVAVGGGWQALVAYINLGSYNIFGFPLALADFVSEITGAPMEEAPKMEKWLIYVDGTSTTQGNGASLVITSPYGEDLEFVVKFGFKVSNNKAEYEALVTGMRMAHELIQIPREENFKADCLSKLASALEYCRTSPQTKRANPRGWVAHWMAAMKPTSVEWSGTFQVEDLETGTRLVLGLEEPWLSHAHDGCSLDLANNPYQIWYGKPASYKYLRVWGSPAYVKRLVGDKLDSRSSLCRFIGYPKETAGYYFYDPTKQKVFVSRNAVFLNRGFPTDTRRDELLLEESSEALQSNAGTSFVPDVSTDNVPILRRSARVP